MGKRLDGRNVGFQLLPYQIAHLREWAVKQDRSMSAVVRRLIDEEIERQPEFSAPVEVEGKS